MSRLKKYINELSKIYAEDIEFTKSMYDEHTLALVPDVLKEFYKEYAEIRLPFGYIDRIETAMEHSKVEPFKSKGWFCFGFDGYFSFWLCQFIPDEENLSITCWDHENGCDIDGAVYKNIIDFFEDMRSEYEESKEGTETVFQMLKFEQFE